MPGHIRRYCDQPLPADKEASTASGGAAKVIHGVDEANIYLAMKLRGRRIPCLMDTGCDLTVVPIRPSSGSGNARDYTPDVGSQWYRSTT